MPITEPQSEPVNMLIFDAIDGTVLPGGEPVKPVRVKVVMSKAQLRLLRDHLIRILKE